MPSSKPDTKESAPAALRASQHFSSVNVSNGSRLLLMVPMNRIGSWGTMLILDLRSARDILVISTPSMRIDPAYGSKTLNSDNAREDFPAPVLPTMPTLSPGEITRLMFLRTSSRSFGD